VATESDAYITAYNMAAESVMEGPQIVLTWDLPTHEDSTHIKLIRKLLAYPEDIADGDELLSSTVGGSPTYYADLNPMIHRAWCYALFTYHNAQQTWASATVFEVGQTVVPTTPNGYFYEALNKGTAGTTEPAWPEVIGDTIQSVDGEITWVCRSTNPSWITGERARAASITWDASYMRELLFGSIPSQYRRLDAYSAQQKLAPAVDLSDNGTWRAIRETGTTEKGELQRFLSIFGIALSRVKGAADFYPQLVDPDECLPQYLSKLAGIVGWELSTTSPTQFQRQEILSAVPVYKTKGTVSGLESLLRPLAGVNAAFLDPMSRHILMSNRINRLGARGGQELAYPDWTATTAYARGTIVIPTSANRTGYYYQVTRAGTSGGTEPAWPTTSLEDIVDGSVTWRTRKYGVPHLTAAAVATATTLIVDDTSEFEAGKTINVRDAATPAGENIIVAEVVDSVTLELERALDNSYGPADEAVVSPAFDWYDDETGFIWDIPVIDQFDGIYPDRIRVPGAVLEPSELYSFEILRVWFLLEAGEAVTNPELERLARIMTQFAPADTRYVVRIEEI